MANTFPFPKPNSCLVLIALPFLAAACDPLGRHFDSVTRIQSKGDATYISVVDDCSLGIGCYPDPAPSYLATGDQGETWEQVPASDIESIIPHLTPGLPAAETECLPNDPSMCFRIEGNPEILISSDGGLTWSTAWRFPLSRKTFATRYMQEVKLLLDAVPDTIPFDMTVPKTPEDGVLFAMGNQGILQRRPTGEWIARAAASASPVPLRAGTISEVQATLATEVSYSIVTSLLFASFLSIRSILRVSVSRRTAWLALLPTTLSTSLLISLCYLTIAYPFGLLSELNLTAITFIPVAGFLLIHTALMARWLQLPRVARHALGLILASVALFVALISPLAVWAFTVGPFWLAVIAAILLAATVAFISTRLLLAITARPNISLPAA